MKNLILTFGIVCIVVICSCTYDNLDAAAVIPVNFCDNITATYDLNIKTIVETNCAYTGCHLAGSAPGDFSTFAGMLFHLENGGIEDRVITQRDDANAGMPPNYASGPKDLTSEEFDIFMCWLETGYPEN